MSLTASCGAKISFEDQETTRAHLIQMNILIESQITGYEIIRRFNRPLGGTALCGSRQGPGEQEGGSKDYLLSTVARLRFPSQWYRMILTGQSKKSRAFESCSII